MFGRVCAAVTVLSVLLNKADANTELMWGNGAKNRLSKESKPKRAQKNEISKFPEKLRLESAKKSKINKNMVKDGKRTAVVNIASFDFEEIKSIKREKKLESFLCELVDEFYFYQYHVICIQNITSNIFDMLSDILVKKYEERRKKNTPAAKYLAVKLFAEKLKSPGRRVRCPGYVTLFDSNSIVCIDSAVSSMHNRHYYENILDSFKTDASGDPCGINIPKEGINNDIALLTYFNVLRKNIRFKVANVFKTLVDPKTEHDIYLRGDIEERKADWHLASFNANTYLQLSMKQTLIDMNRYLGLESNPSSNKFVVGNFGAPPKNSQRVFLCNILKYGYIPGHDYSYIFYDGPDYVEQESEIPYKAIGSQVPIGFYTSDSLNELFAELYHQDSLSCIYHTHQIQHFATLMMDTSSIKQSVASNRFKSTKLNVPSCTCCYIVPDCYDDDGYSWTERKKKYQDRKSARRNIVESLRRTSVSQSPDAEDDSSEDFSGISTDVPSSSGEHPRASSDRSRANDMCVIS